MLDNLPRRVTVPTFSEMDDEAPLDAYSELLANRRQRIFALLLDLGVLMLVGFFFGVQFRHQLAGCGVWGRLIG